jgi:Prealbumin-like fold domain/DNA circularisation protein N-terminus
MPIELAKIQLNRVHQIDTLERAALVHHAVPGLEGSLTQNLGRDSVRLRIEGIFYGLQANQDLETLRKAYKQREPVDFLTDIVGQAYFSQVLLEQFEVFQSAQFPEQFSYRLTIAEYVPPKKNAAANQAAVKKAIKKQATALMDIATLPDALTMGSIPELTNPAAPLNGAVDQVATALSGINGPMAGLSALSTVPTEAATEPPQPLPQPAPLAWVKPPPIEDLLQAGVPVKNLLSSGASVETLVKAGASALDLRQAGISADQLTQAGVAANMLQSAENTLKVVAVLETIPRITLEFLDEDNQPLAHQAYCITKSNKTIVTGELDDRGQCQLDIVTGDTFTIALPNIDGNDWNYVVPIVSSPIDSSDRDPIASSNSEITFQLLNEEGSPYAQQPYEIILPNGRTQTGQLDDQGQAHLDNIPAGICSLSFPNLDAEDWQLIPPETPEIPEIPETPETPALDGTSQISFALVDEDGIPVARQEYQIRLPDGRTQTGHLDDQGQAHFTGIAAGHCEVTFPNLDAADWQLAQESIAPVPIPESSELSFTIVSDEGTPLAGIRYELQQAEAIVRQGISDQNGQVQIPDLAAGTYSITFPGLDAGDWQLNST